MMQSTLKPVRGCYVRVGDVLRPKPETRCKVLWRFAADSMTIIGEWRLLDERAAALPEEEQVQPFELSWISWYSLEAAPVDIS